MLTRMRDFDHPFDVFEELRRRMDRVWDDFDDRDRGPGARLAAGPGFPRVDVEDTGATLVVRADLPGLPAKDVELTLHDGMLTISAKRNLTVPEGFAPLRQERPSFELARTLALPCKVDAEKTTAVVDSGVLTVTLTKAPDATPRRIAVKASA